MRRDPPASRLASPRRCLAAIVEFPHLTPSGNAQPIPEQPPLAPFALVCRTMRRRTSVAPSRGAPSISGLLMAG